MMLTAMPKYDTYKNSGVEWIGDIPAHWNIRKLKYISNINNQTLPENTAGDFLFDYVDIGSVTLENGIEKVETFRFSDAPSRARRLAKQGDTVVSTVRTYLKAISYVDRKSSEYIYSTGFAVINPKDENSSKYLTHFIKSDAFTNQVDDVAKGISYPAINSSELSNLLVVEPSTPEKNAIADFLDEKTAKIDDAIAIKERQIALLNERKQILIQQAITQGLDPNVPMKDSCVAWIGTIPAHWSIKRAKYLFDEINDRSINGDEELLSVSHITGVTPRSEKNVNMFMAEDYSGSKTCKKNDLVINIMWAWMGALGVSDREGIVSPSYGVFREKTQNTFNPVFLEHLLKSKSYIEHYNQVSTGLHSSRLRFYGHMFFDMAIGFPSFEEQNRIIDYVQKESKNIDKALLLQEQQITLLKEYKTTLINSAVTGKIKVV
ncbi:restriction endonuclease subunit S [Aeromonas jandaei]|uniref:restriction endonuclease subunit S n=1 Tax=Aeromonas jandaei TaxID=650 RepID=UPI0038CF2CC0